MGLRDRFYTPTTARALLSWRLGLGAAVAVGLVVAGLGPVAASLAGLVAYGLAVWIAMPRQARPAAIDPFTLSEPWRHFVQGAQRSRGALAATVQATRPGPLHDRLADIAGRLDTAVAESWQIARRGDEIDAAVTRIDPVRLRSRLATLKDQPPEGAAEAVASLESQLATADRLKALSASTAERLRLTQVRLDELVARAAEVSVGTSDTDEYASAVDDLVVELEALRQAVAVTESAPGAAGP